MSAFDAPRSTREAYEDWKPLIEWEQDNAAEDTEQMEEELMVEQTNGPRGTSAGGPADPGYTEPLWRKPPNPRIAGEVHQDESE